MAGLRWVTVGYGDSLLNPKIVMSYGEVTVTGAITPLFITRQYNSLGVIAPVTVIPKQIRFDLQDFHGDPNGPHINLETWAPRNLYPGDTRMQQIENLHIYPKGP